MSIFDDLSKEVTFGLEGRNDGIPMGFNRLNKYVGIRKSIYFLIGGLTGCLSGETLINVSRGKRPSGRDYSLQELYHKFNGLKLSRKVHDKRNGHDWISTKSRAISYNQETKFTGYNEIVRVVQSGIKETFTLTTASGKSIRATKDHQFLISDSGIYRSLGELLPGDFVYIQSISNPKGRVKQFHRSEIIIGMPYYLSARKKDVKNNGITYHYHRISRTRAVYDSVLNNVSLDEFLYQIKFNPNNNFVFSDLKMDIHHIDEDPDNDSPENLILLTKIKHSKLHEKDKLSHFGNREIVRDMIVSIERFGEEMTYDIEMTAPNNNFLANGIIVHNSGKTSFVDDAFVLNPYDWYISPENKTNIKLKIIYRSMERNRTYKLAKWVGRKIFIDQGIIIPVSKLLGWGDRLSKDEHDLFLMYKDYINNLSEVVTIIDGPENPIGIAKQIRDHALSRGRIDELDQYNKVYIPNDEREITIVVEDTLNLLKLTKELNSKKAAIDKMSDENRYARDFFGYTIAAVSQFNRSIGNIQRIKNGDVEPQLEDFKESGQSQDDADVVMTLFDPVRYKVADPSGYDMDKLMDAEGSKFFRSLRLIKNSYGSDDVRIGLGFLGEMGMFKELPKRSVITDDDYTSIINKSYFLQDRR